MKCSNGNSHIPSIESLRLKLPSASGQTRITEWRASIVVRSPILSFVEEQSPLGDGVGVANECRYRQLLRRARDGEELKAGLVRQPVALPGVHDLARPHEVVPRVLATARAWQNVVEAAFVRLQHLARVLAAVVVALTNRLRAQLRALLRHLGEVHRRNHRRHTLAK